MTARDPVTPTTRHADLARRFNAAPWNEVRALLVAAIAIESDEERAGVLIAALDRAHAHGFERAIREAAGLASFHGCGGVAEEIRALGIDR